MIRAFLPKAVLLLALSLVLAVSSLQAAEPGPLTRAVSHVSPSSALWEALVQAWTNLTRAWAANGCGLDPDGRCLPPESTAGGTDNGCDIDPNGRCLPSATAAADNGCGLDPNGRCGS